MSAKRRRGAECHHSNCHDKPFYNYKHSEGKIYCKDHKKENMVNKKNRICQFGDCITQCKFNIPGAKFSLYCSKHKKEGMIDITSKKCLHCNTRANFNLIGGKPLYCLEHKTEEMVNIKSKKCLHCHKRPNFNLEGSKIPIYCSEHKLENMIDIVSKKCLNCNKGANFNREGFKIPIYCSKHKLENMVDVRSKKCLNCNKRANFNIPGSNIGLYCYNHKNEEMINVKAKKCLTNLCNINVSTKYKGYCYRCFIFMYPDHPLIRNHKTKDKAVTDFIIAKFSNYNWILDKTITGGTSLRRPDILLNLDHKVLIIEIDENMHKYINCENRRIMEIAQDLKYKDMILIRFNPDSYRDENNNKIKSPWGTTNKKEYIKIIDEKNWTERLNLLKDKIEYWIANDSDKNMEIIELFYDQN